MLNKIIEFSIKNKLIIGLFVCALIGYGIYEVKKLPIDAVPDITDNQVQVITVAPSLGAPDVERLITFPIEQVNNNIPGLKSLRSFSRFGLSVVTIVFDDNTDVYWARQQVSERLQQVQDQIPKGFGTPTLAPVTTGLGEIYQYSVRPKKGYEGKYNAMELRTIQDWIVRRQLIGVQGVAEVSSFGGLLKQYEIAVDPSQLKANNITISDVFVALENNNENTGGAYIEKGPTALFIRSEGLVGTQEDIQNIVVKNLPNGIPLLVRDIAEVKLGSATRYGAMTYNGQTQVSGAVVMMLKGANSNEVIKNIKEKITQIQKTLPEGVEIDPFLDRTKMVDNSINTVTKNLIEGALIVVFVLVFFLGSMRAGLIVASVIPLSMLVAVILMNVFGVSGNLMSLGALDFGLIVDGAVIIVEAVMHRIRHSKAYAGIDMLSQKQMDAEVLSTSTRMRNAAVFGEAIILIVYLPIFALKGIEGKMFTPMAQTVAFALVGAFILSLTYVPMMTALFLSKKVQVKENFSDRIMAKLEKFYKKLLERVLGIPKMILISVVALFAASILILSTLGGEFIPTLPEGDFAVETRVLPGSNVNTSIDAVSKGSKIILEKFPEVEKVVGKTGSSEVPTDPMPIDATDMMIILKDKKEWTSADSYEELEEKMAKELEAVPGVTFSFQYPVAMRFNELISGARQDVVCKIFGEDLDTLALYADQLGKIVGSVKGSSGVYVEAVTGMPQIVIKYNRATIAQYGMNIKNINKIVNSAFAGAVGGTVYEGEKRFDLVVRLSGDKRQNLEDVQNLLVSTPNGEQIPLSSVADVNIVEGPNQIQREDSQRRIIVGFNVRGRDVQSMVQELQDKVGKQMKLPPGYYVTYGGAFENLQEAKSRLYVAVPVALTLILILLYFAFNSMKQAFLIYTAIPLSAIGGIFALALRGMPFSISAGIGFIALFGVAVLNGIVLISEFNRLRKDGMTNLRDVVMEGTNVRLRPVLMTAFVASLGFLPMALSTGEGAEVQKPLATVVIGGLMVATLLTLFVLPILYIMVEKRKFTFKRKPGKEILLLLLFLGGFTANAQTVISLKEATKIALENNLSVKSEKLRSDYNKLLIKTNAIIPATNVTAEFGQINSFYTDVRAGISQSIDFPKVYSANKNLLTEVWKNSILNVGVKEAQLRKNVALVYNNLVYLQQKKVLLQENDKLYAEFLSKANLRFKVGESNILEKTTAEHQRGQIAIQLNQLEKDLEISQLQFQLLLNTEVAYTADSNDSIYLEQTSLNKDAIAGHPYLQYLKQKKDVSVAETEVEKSKLLPTLSLGYNIMGMKGMGADNKEYNSTPRFQSVLIGVGIPIFNGGQKAKIKASEANQALAVAEYEYNLKNFETGYHAAVLDFQKYNEIVDYYLNTGMKHVETINSTAKKQFLGGDIDYLQWVMLTNQAIDIRNQYIEALKNRNNSLIEINSYDPNFNTNGN
ncbi:CusA/CzcA family heavy metal efflux RND transporter [Elizabethkingia miricola]|uniref:CusA/CzcA family heavy metal efflux RND transporter n=1 Tax=Elizabethkingia miricola TaxID=172045 RepID=UPI003891C6D7